MNAAEFVKTGLSGSLAWLLVRGPEWAGFEWLDIPPGDLLPTLAALATVFRSIGWAIGVAFPKLVRKRTEA